MDTEKDRALFAFNRAHYGDTIREARGRRSLTQKALADRLGVAKNYVSNWEAGRARPDLNLVPALCEALGLELPVFFGAHTDMDMLSPAEKKHLRGYRRLSEENRSAVDALMDAMLRVADERLRARAALYRPILRHELRASAGTGNPLDAGGDGERVYICGPDTEQADCLIRVFGDSMEPDLHDGDDLLVQYADTVRVGEIGIFVANGDGYVKEYRTTGLHSRNPEYADLHFTEDDDVRCVGRVLGVLAPERVAPDEIRELLEQEG